MKKKKKKNIKNIVNFTKKSNNNTIKDLKNKDIFKEDGTKEIESNNDEVLVEDIMKELKEEAKREILESKENTSSKLLMRNGNYNVYINDRRRKNNRNRWKKKHKRNKNKRTRIYYFH